MKQKLRNIVIIGALCGFVVAPLSVAASEFWEEVVSPAGLFSTDIRKDHELKSEYMLIGGNRAVYHEEISSVVDHRPFKKVFKNYVVSIDQTFGPLLEHKERAWLAQREVDDLIKSYSAFDTIIQDRKKDYGSIYKGESVTFVYDDPDFGAQAVIFVVKVGAVSKYKQIAIVPVDFMEDREVVEYLKSMRFEEGIIQSKKKILEEWSPVTSPHRIFSAMIPPKVSPYFPKDPIVRKSDNASVVRYVFRDPVKRQNVYYNLYEYKVDEDLEFKDVENIIGKYHVKEHRRDPSVIKYTKRIEKKTPYLHAKYKITPTKKIPYMNAVQLRGFFNGKSLFVQEVIGSEILISTPFVKNLLSLYKFHPEHAVPLGAEAVDTQVQSGIEGTMEAIIAAGDTGGFLPERLNARADEKPSVDVSPSTDP